VPTTGSIDRILASHFDFGGGVTYAKANSQVDPTSYKGEYQGRLQPYNLYVPAAFSHSKAYPLTLLLHSLAANYNQYMQSNNQTEFGERGAGTIVATSESRGPDGWYYDSAEADVFEMWNDVAHHYLLDPTKTTLTGYSMGGYATYKLGTQFPDLFARAFVTVGPPADGIWTGPPGVIPATGGDQTNTYFMLESLRNLPILIWHGTNDELVPADGPQLVARRLDALNYRYEIDTFPGYDHFAFAIADNYTRPTAFLDDSTVVANPPHISYVVNPTMDFSGVGVVANKAYWLSGLTVRDPSKTRGNLDVRSEGFCSGDAPASATQFGADVAATPYTREYKTWGDAPAAPCADTLDITAGNVSRIVVDAQRARIDCNVKINLSSDGPVDVRIVNAGDSPCGGVVQPASLGGATVAGVLAATTAATLPNTASASGAGATGAAGLAALGVGVLARSRRRRRAAGLG
jgi:MYXO-CTERM domain-containing protein